MKSALARLVSIGHHTPRAGWHIGAHSHLGHEMVIVVRGREDVLVRESRIRVGVGDVLLFGPGVTHEEWGGADEPLETYFLHIEWPGEEAKGPVALQDAAGRVRLLAAWLHEERVSALPEARRAHDAFFDALIGEYVRLTRQVENPLVASVRSYIRQNLAQPLTLAVLAAHAGMSKYHFIRRYRALTGRSPMEDVRVIRTTHARDLILTTGLPLKAVAPMSGLGDEVTLYRLFRRHFRMTPGQIRRSVRQGR